MNDQNTATAKRLNTLTQTKKTRATITVATPAVSSSQNRARLGGEKVVRDEACPRHSRDQRTVERLRHEQRDEGSGEHPW